VRDVPSAPADPAEASPADFPDSPLARAFRQPLVLGLFLPIQDGGWSPSTLPRTTTWTFDYNAALTRRAEALGFDLVFGLAQWTPSGGYGGTMRYRENALDSFMAVSMLAPVTSRIILISTLHILYGPWHPLHLAKFGATLDHVAHGRWGVNVVTGYAAREPLMFGMRKIEHDLRYVMADEFTTIAKRLWSGRGNLTHNGRFWSVEDGFVSPRPLFGRPILVNAAGSPAGIDYAVRHSDMMFVTSPTGNQIEDAEESLPAHTARIRQAALAAGRAVRLLINPMILCRPTEREAKQYRDAIVAHADHEAVGGFANHGRTGDAQAWRNQKRQHAPVGGNVHIVGSPEQIVDGLLKLKRAGCDGVQLTFFDFAPDLEYFGEAVLPIMYQAGLRLPLKTSAA
jgi:dimethylsulfone monooxygenase